MPQPGTNGMEPIFGEAYGTHRCIMTLESFPASPLGGSTEHDQKESLQGVVLMLGSPAVPRKRPFELLSDLVDDGFIEDLHHEHWDVSALDDISRYTKGSPEGELPSSDNMLMGRGGNVPAEQALAVGASSSLRLHSAGQTGAVGPGMALKPTAHADPVAQGQEEVGEAGTGEAPQSLGASTSSPSALEHCSEEHNYSLQAEQDSSSSQSSDSETVDTEEEEEGGSEADEDATKGMDFRISGPECDQDPDAKAGVRQRKRRCFWEYRHSHEAEGNSGACKLPLSWSSSTLPSTLYLREGTSSSGKKCPRKARKTDANDLTPNPQKLRSIGEQLLKLNLAIEGMRPVNDLPVVARARSRKEKNKLASRACRLKKKAQHEANKIKLWGLNQEYDNLLAALLRIKEGIRRRVESSEEEDKVGMTKKLQDILKESAGPHVAGRTKEFVERILDCSAAGQGTKRA